MFKLHIKINFNKDNFKLKKLKCTLMILLNLRLSIKTIIGYKWNKMKIINIQY